MKRLKIWLKIDIFGELALRHVDLLFQKTTADDDDDEVAFHIFVVSKHRYFIFGGQVDRG